MVGVGRVIGGEPGGVEEDGGVGGEDAERGAGFGVGDDEGAPALAVAVCLGPEAGGDGFEAGGGEAGDVLSVVGSVL